MTRTVRRIKWAMLLGVIAPFLKWQKGGCYPSWCETGWYSSPAPADLDGDGETGGGPEHG